MNLLRYQHIPPRLGNGANEHRDAYRIRASQFQKASAQSDLPNTLVLSDRIPFTANHSPRRQWEKLEAPKMWIRFQIELRSAVCPVDLQEPLFRRRIREALYAGTNYLITGQSYSYAHLLLQAINSHKLAS